MRRVLGIVAVVEGLAIIVVGVLLLVRRSDGNRSESRPTGTTPAAPVTAAPSPAATPGKAAPEAAPATAPAPETPDTLAPAPGDAGILLFGKVTDDHGQPVGKAELALQGPGDRQRFIRVENGGFAAAGLGAGTWNVRVTAPEHREVQDIVELATAEARVRKDIVLPRSVILKIRFRTPGGEPLADALKTLKSDESRPIFPTAVATPGPLAGDLPPTASSQAFLGGRYRAFGTGAQDQKPGESGVDGTLELTLDPPVHVSAVLRHIVLATESVPAGADTVTLTVDPQRILGSLASVRLRVLDAATKEPVTKARVALTDRQMGGGGRAPGPDGVLVFENMRPGLLALGIDAPGLERVQQIVRIAPGRVNDLGAFELASGLGITGRIVDEAGQPVACGVSAYSLDRLTFPQEFDLGVHTSSGPDGRFGMGQLGRGRHLVRSGSKTHARAAVVVDTSSGPISDVVLRLGPGVPVTLAVTTPSLRRWVVQVKDARGVLLESVGIGGDGELKCRLLPGPYRVEVYEDDALHRSVPLEVADRPVTLAVSP